MKTYLEFLQESEESALPTQLKHLTHLEDVLIESGLDGAKDSLNILRKTVDILSGNQPDSAIVQLKVDGAPAVIAGIDPVTSKFFVSTKSLFNKDPKINFTDEDIDKNHSNSEGLSKKLKYALKYLPEIIKSGIYQGDFLYSDYDITKQNINGTSYITFTPNTITYAVPVDSELYGTIMGTKMGFAIHTSYSGKTIETISAKFEVKDGFKSTSNIFVFSTTLTSAPVLFTPEEVSTLNDSIDELEKELNKFKSSDLDIIQEMKIDIMAFLNSLIRSEKSLSNNSVKEFMDYLSAKSQKAADKLKSDKGKEKVISALEDNIKKIRSSAGALYYVLLWNKNAGILKTSIIKKISELSKFNTFVKSGDDYKVTAPEGLVAIDVLKNSAIKLVDRLEFSKLNFMNSRF